MPTSGVRSARFNVDRTIENALRGAGIDPSEATFEAAVARDCLLHILVEMAADKRLPWFLETRPISTSEGSRDYTLAADVIDVMHITIVESGGNTRTLSQISSRKQWDELTPSVGTPTTYHYTPTTPGTLSLDPTPDGVYQLSAWCAFRGDDPTSGAQYHAVPEIAQNYIEHRLALDVFHKMPAAYRAAYASVIVPPLMDGVAKSWSRLLSAVGRSEPFRYRKWWY